MKSSLGTLSGRVHKKDAGARKRMPNRVQMAMAWRSAGALMSGAVTRVRPTDVMAFGDAMDGMCAWLQMPPPEEIETMQSVLDGLKDQSIARREGVSVITVRRRVGRYLERTGAKNRIQGAVVGVLQGWLTLELAERPQRDQTQTDTQSRTDTR